MERGDRCLSLTGNCCVPGSVPPFPGVTAIRLRRPSPDACSSLPGSSRGPRSTILADGLLPYLALLQVGFTLPSALTDAVRSYRTISPLPSGVDTGRRYIFCGTFRGLAPPRHYLAPCPVEPGLSSGPP